MYELQKLIRDVGRRPDARAADLKDSAAFADTGTLTQKERVPLLARGNVAAAWATGIGIPRFDLDA